MVQGSFVLSAYKIKPEAEKLKINERQTNMRYVVIVLAIFVVFGCQYCFDNPSALQRPIQENLSNQGDQISEFKFNLLYSLYAFPNMIIPLIGGILIDKIGARIILIGTASFCVIGQLIFGFGGYQNSFLLMLAGRVVFGIGGEVLHASQNTLISNWFKASELSMVLGICLSFPKMGSSLNSYLSPLIEEKYRNGQENDYLNVAAPLFLGAILMSVSLMLAIVLAFIDRRSDVILQQQPNSEGLITSQKQKSVRSISPGARPASLINATKKKSKEEVNFIQTSEVRADEKVGVEGGQHLNCKEIGNLPFTFWLIILISMLAEALFIPFLDNGNAYYQDVFKLNTTEAGIYLIMPYCVSSLFVVILGYVVDKLSKRSYALIASCFFFTFTYLFMMFLEATESFRNSSVLRWAPSFLLGICIAIFCAVIVPTVPMLVSPKLLGTGFGIMETLQNFALGVFPLIAGVLRQTQGGGIKGFHFQTLFFFLVSCICASLSVILKAVDLTTGNRLDVKDFRKKYLKEIMKEDIES